MSFFGTDYRPTPGEQEVADAAAAWWGRSTRAIRWRGDAPGGTGLVVHAPWARVVVARSARSARRWLQACPTGRGTGRVLLDALEEAYPTRLIDWADAIELQQAPMPEGSYRSFVAWALGPREADFWPLGFDQGAQLGVVGAWATWPDAVLVYRRDKKETTYQLRGAAWATPAGVGLASTVP